jgi:hypothetical protein
VGTSSSSPKTAGRSVKGRSSAASGQPGKGRKIAVFVGLVGALSLTSAILLALAPAPLRPDAVSSLFAVQGGNASESLAAIYQTEQPVQPGRWKYIYLRHSKSLSGNAYTVATPTGGLGDHFVICNGEGGVDGELQVGQRWALQQDAQAPKGTNLDPGGITICLIGDFDLERPTTAQRRRLEQLLTSLQDQLQIPPTAVWTLNHPNSTASIGRLFNAPANVPANAPSLPVPTPAVYGAAR